MSVLERIRIIVFGRSRDRASAQNALGNIGQIEVFGAVVQQPAFGEPPAEPIELDQTELPWELRDDPR